MHGTAQENAQGRMELTQKVTECNHSVTFFQNEIRLLQSNYKP